MKRASLFVALVVVVGTLLVPVAGVTAQETETEDEGMAPGERLSGVVGVQAAEVDGDIERNAFRIGLERANDNASKASHIATKLNESESRLTELNERKAELEAQRENGTISEGQYRARMARLATETETVRGQLNRSNATAAELPEETLRENGVNTTAIRTLRTNADELSGPEVAEIARSIAGNRSGMVDRGPPADRGGDRNASDDRPGGPNADDERGEERAGNGGASDERPGDRDGAPDGADEAPSSANEEQDDEETTDDGRTDTGSDGGDGDADADGADSTSSGPDSDAGGNAGN
jgi:hypothetical protein